MTKTKNSPIKALLVLGIFSVACAGLISPMTFAEEVENEEQLKANFTQCLVNAYNSENQTSLTSLTDAQLAAIKKVSCGKSMTVNLNKLTALEELEINPILDQKTDLSGNTALKKVTLITMSGTTNYEVILPSANLEYLSLRAKSLKSLDLTNFSKLQTVSISGDTAITLPTGDTLKEISLYYNKYISKLDFSKNPQLKLLDLYECDFESLDLSNNKELIDLKLRNGVDVDESNRIEGKLESIDLSNNTKLEKIIVSGAKITKLDLSKNPNVEHLELRNNSNLTQLDMSGLTKDKDSVSLFLNTNENLQIIAVPESWKEIYTEEEIRNILGVDEDQKLEVQYGAIEEEAAEGTTEEAGVKVPNTGAAISEMVKYAAIVALPTILVFAVIGKNVVKIQRSKVKFSR